MSKRQHTNGPGPIPNRWLKCPNKSDDFIANKFVAFKTPLSQKFDSQVQEHSFYPSMIFDLIKTYYKKKIGLWIDLTNTNRFYDKSEIEKKNCRYVKLQCRGFGEAPSPEQVQSFIELVEEFSASNPMDVIGVHCTHGFNRTGFLIASYLVERNDYSVDAAIQMFAQARQPGIYKQEYINELYKRYEDVDDATPAPALPDWCFDEEETPDDYYGNTSQDASNDNEEPDDNENDQETSGEPSNKKPRKRRSENIRLDAVFMEGVPGVTLMTDKKEVNALQALVQDFCDWSKGGFPGAQPVSMDRQNIKLLTSKPYKVSWKADGMRYMMLIHKRQEMYFFDRDNCCFKIDGLTFPHVKDLTKHISNTLLDGEMVIDKVKGRCFPRYLVYDIIRYENRDYRKETFDERMKAIRNYIIAPRHEAMKRGIINRELEPFSVRVKDFWDITQAAALLGPKFAEQLSHKPDGLIFQPKLEPYVGGRCDDILKWKPAEENSVDFQLKITEESGVGMLTKKRALLYVGSMSTPFSEMKYSKDMKELHGKIIECKFEGGKWVFMRERTDKSFPNAYNTAIAVCNSIQNPVTKDDLLMYIDKRRYIDKSEPPRSYHPNHH